MLTYIQNSDSKNAVDDATRMMDSYVSRVKNLPEVEAGYMTLGDWIDGIKEDMREDLRQEVKEEVKEEIKEEVKEEVKEEDIRIMVEVCQEYHDTKENATDKVRSKFPEYAGQAEELVARYWKKD